MPENRNEIEQIATAERQAAILSASIAQIREALESLKAVSDDSVELRQQFEQMAEMANRLRYIFNHLNDENLPHARRLIIELRNELERLNVDNLTQSIRQSREEFNALARRAERLRELRLRLGLVNESEVGQYVPTPRQQLPSEVFQQMVSLLEDIKGTLERKPVTQPQISPPTTEPPRREERLVSPFIRSDVGLFPPVFIPRLPEIPRGVQATPFNRELFESSLLQTILHVRLPETERVEAGRPEERGLISPPAQPQPRTVVPQPTLQPAFGDWREVEALLQDLGVTNKEIHNALKEAFERGDVAQMTRLLQNISREVLNIKTDLPDDIKDIIGRDVLSDLEKAISEGNVDMVSDIVHAIDSRLRGTNRRLDRLLANVNTLSENGSALPTILREMRRTRSSFNEFASTYSEKILSEAGLGGVLSSLRNLQRTVARFGKSLGYLAIIFEIILEIYRFLQKTYMEGRNYILMTEMPGAGALVGFAQANLTQRDITRAVRQMALDFRNYMDRAYRDLRIPEQDYMQILRQLRETSLLVEGSFQGLNIALIASTGDMRRFMRVTDQLVRRFYSLSYATGMSVSTLMNGARQIMRLTGSHDIERSLRTFIALNEIGTRFNISGQQMVEWVTSASQQLRWFGYSLASNTRVIRRHAQALYEGLVSVQQFTQAVQQFTGQNEQLQAIGFMTAMNQQNELGRVLRRAMEEGGLLQAFSLFRILIQNSEETIRRAAERDNLAGEAARRVLELTGDNLSRLIQTARGAELGGAIGIAQGVGGGAIAGYEIFTSIASMNKNIASTAETLDGLKDYFEKSQLDSVNSSLKPLSNFSKLIETTNDMLEASKNLRQELVDIKIYLRRLLSKFSWFFGGGGVPTGHIRGPSSR